MKRFYQQKKGSLSVDFMFGISILSIALIFIVLLSLSLVYAEVSQYVTYASARKYFAAYETPSMARRETLSKYREMRDSLFPKNIGWFSIGVNDNPNSVDIFVKPDYQKMRLSENFLQKASFGIYIEYTSKVFGMKIPFLKDEESSMFFPTASLLGSEPNKQLSCKMISRLSGNFRNPNYFYGCR